MVLPLFSPVYFTVDMILLKRLSIKGMASNMDSVICYDYFYNMEKAELKPCLLYFK